MSAKEFGVHLRRCRVNAGLSLADLSQRVHYNKGHLSKVERGLRAPSAHLIRMCDAALGADGELSRLATEDAGRELTTPHWTDEGGWPPAIAIGAVAARQDEALHHFQAIFTHLRLLGRVATPSAVLRTLVEQTRSIGQLAATAQGTWQIRLLTLAAYHAEYAGWMVQEAGDDDAALAWTEKARQLADRAGDLDLAAYALVRQAEVALYQRRSGDVVALARRAQAGRETGPRVRALAAHREAQGHALAGRSSSCFAALDRAVALWHEPGDRPAPEIVLGSSSVRDMHALVAGWCHYDLGRPDLAVRALDRAVAGISISSRRARALHGARLAASHAAADAPDHACEVAHRVLDDAAFIGSASVSNQLRELARLLRRWPRHRPAREVEIRLNEALAPSRVASRLIPRPRATA